MGSESTSIARRILYVAFVMAVATAAMIGRAFILETFGPDEVSEEVQEE